MFRGSSISKSFEGPTSFITDCWQDELDIIELGYGPTVAMINENDLGPEHAKDVIRVRGNRAR